MDFIIALLVGVGFGVWVYTKLARNNGGGNAKNAAIGGSVAGFVAFIVVFTLAHMLLKSSS